MKNILFAVGDVDDILNPSHNPSFAALSKFVVMSLSSFLFKKRVLREFKPHQRLGQEYLRTLLSTGWLQEPIRV